MSLTDAGPSIEPITLAEAKTHLRVDGTDEESRITGLIVAARIAAENMTRRAFISRVFTWKLDRFLNEVTGDTTLRLPRSRVSAIGTLQYVDTSGTTQTLASSEYTLDGDTEPARLFPAFGKFWPSIRDVRQAVTIPFTAGYGSAASDVPDGIKEAMYAMIGDWFNNRGDFAPPRWEALPIAVRRALYPYVVPEFV